MESQNRELRAQLTRLQPAEHDRRRVGGSGWCARERSRLRAGCRATEFGRPADRPGGGRRPALLGSGSCRSPTRCTSGRRGAPARGGAGPRAGGAGSGDRARSSPGCAAGSAGASPPTSSSSSTSAGTAGACEVAIATAPDDSVGLGLGVVVDAAFYRYLREAVDYAGGGGWIAAAEHWPPTRPRARRSVFVGAGAADHDLILLDDDLDRSVAGPVLGVDRVVLRSRGRATARSPPRRDRRCPRAVPAGARRPRPPRRPRRRAGAGASSSSSSSSSSLRAACSASSRRARPRRPRARPRSARRPRRAGRSPR